MRIKKLYHLSYKEGKFLFTRLLPPPSVGTIVTRLQTVDFLSTCILYSFNVLRMCYDYSHPASIGPRYHALSSISILDQELT